MLRKKIIVFILYWMHLCTSYQRCGQKEKITAVYHLVRPCTNSKMGILASANLLTVNSCMTFARNNNGLAMSFLSEGMVQLDNEDEETTCLVFDCPEFEPTLNLQQSSSYYYYSLYAKPLPNVNVTCIPGLGVFIYHSEQLNHSQAENACEINGGQLASVLTDQRTRFLSELLSNFGGNRRNVQAYVGLDDIQNEGTFVSSTGHLLDCSYYRAWAPGEPHSRKDNEDCVVLNTQQQWQVVSCKKKLPFICEIAPAGPFQLCNSISLTGKRECLENHINRTEILKENPRCHLPPLYEKNATDMLAELDKTLNNTTSSETE